MRTQHSILLVDDDGDLARGLADALEPEGYRVSHLTNGSGVLQQISNDSYDLVILDVMLPGGSGFDILRKVRERKNPVPVLMLTAKGQETDKVRGLRLGADDYVTKPFGIMELLARIEALLRRSGVRDRSALRLEMGEILVNFTARQAWRNGREIGLTARELEILETLVRRRGEAVSREDLLARIWGLADDVEVTTRTVDQHIAALRRKLGDDASAPRLIETVYGHGYRLGAAFPKNER